MQKALRIVAVLLAVVVLVSSCSAVMTASQTIHSYGIIRRLPWLSLDGQWIVNEEGDRVALRGTGFDYTAYRKWDWFDEFVADVKSRGYNNIRLAFNTPLPENDPDAWINKHTSYDPEWMDYAIDTAEQNGIYVTLVNMAWWAADDVQGWEMPLPDHEQEWIDNWVEIATRYKDRSAVFAYELYNEPLGPGATPDGKNIQQCYFDVMDAIREVDTKHPFIVYEDSHWLYNTLETEAGVTDRLLWDSDTVRSDTIYASHHWWGEGATATDDYADAYRQAAMYVDGLQYYRDWLGVAVWAGEFGTYDYGDYSNANWDYVREVIRLCEEVGISWNYWQMEAFKQYAPDALEQITPVPYTTNIYSPDIPKQAVTQYGLENPRPYNIWNRVSDQFWAIGVIGQHRWGSTWMSLPNSNFWVDITGPVVVSVRVWEGSNPFGELLSDENITILDGEQRRFEGNTYTEIYAEEDLAT